VNAPTAPLRSVLMVAYHFPPLAGSSGIQRTLRFAQQLPAFGWQPLVLTAHPRAYERVSSDLEADLAPGTVVRRAYALDTARHLSIGGRYVGAMARPDRWVSWRFDAVRVGLQMIRRHRPQAIWSTYPIATAHLIGAALAQRSGLPWIADFRDPMAQDGYPADPLTWQQFKDIEQRTLAHARRSVFTTPGAAREYARRYPAFADRIAVIENGYDEDSFAAAAASISDRSPLKPGGLTLLHSGIVYPEERDPTQLMAALRQLADAGTIRPGMLTVRFRAAQHDALLRTLAERYQVQPYVEIVPPVGYREALAEMLRADVLLVMQAANCNDQIPAKAYEYLRSGRPVIGLTDPAGDTAGVLRRSGITAQAPLDDAAAIAALIGRLLDGSLQGLLPEACAVAAASRLSRTEQLAGELDRLAGGLTRAVDRAAAAQPQ
jgi:glycosyltransferase involved in cell wall biosynthesis